MSIQFSCPGCSQPIEVDAEHAGLSATCPYCSNVVTVPAASTFAPDAPIAARPAGDITHAPGLHVGPTESYERRMSRKYARFALCCALISWAALFVMFAFLYAKILPKLDAAPTSQPSQEEALAILKNIMQEYPWFVTLPPATGLFALVGFALALTSLRYASQRNGMGVLSAILCGGLIFGWLGLMLLGVLGIA